MSLTLDLDNRGDMLRKILVPMIYLSRRGTVQCTRNDMSIQALDAQRRTMAVLTLKFNNFNCCLENRMSYIACINLMDLFHIVASHRDETVTVYGSNRDHNIRFEFRDIGGDVVTRSVVTQTIDPPEKWMIVSMLMAHRFVYEMLVLIPSEEIRRALGHLDLPILVGLPTNLAVVVHVNHQEVRFTAREQSVKIHGWDVFGLLQDEQFVITMAFKQIKSYIAASRFSETVWLFKSRSVYPPDSLVCPIRVEGVTKAFITYYYSKCSISPIEENYFNFSS